LYNGFPLVSWRFAADDVIQLSKPPGYKTGWLVALRLGEMKRLPASKELE
jgi:hypothetical protein